MSRWSDKLHFFMHTPTNLSRQVMLDRRMESDCSLGSRSFHLRTREGKNVSIRGTRLLAETTYLHTKQNLILVTGDSWLWWNLMITVSKLRPKIYKCFMYMTMIYVHYSSGCPICSSWSLDECVCWSWNQAQIIDRWHYWHNDKQ